MQPFRERGPGHPVRRFTPSLAGQPQLSGDTRTLADISSLPFVRQFASNDRAWFDAQPIPQLQRWLDGHLQSALFANVMSRFSPWKAGDKRVVFGT